MHLRMFGESGETKTGDFPLCPSSCGKQGVAKIFFLLHKLMQRTVVLCTQNYVTDCLSLGAVIKKIVKILFFLLGRKEKLFVQGVVMSLNRRQTEFRRERER